ncbi:hypothetical protein BJV77DRAFT_1007583 [Russula vinacea]|nr:hypothetical protein BJV77DRAFT_1007583 [Russula vinacea]
MDPWASEKANLIDILPIQDYSSKKNDSVSDITRNLRNFRPTFELREEWLYNNRFSETWTSFGRLIPPWIQEEYVDLVAGTAGIISCVEDLARHSLGSNGSKWWCRPRFKCTIIPSAELEYRGPGGANALESNDLYGLGWIGIYLGHDVSDSCSPFDTYVTNASLTVISHPEMTGVSHHRCAPRMDRDHRLAMQTRRNSLINTAAAAIALAWSASSPTANQPLLHVVPNCHAAPVWWLAEMTAEPLRRYGSGELCSVRSSSPSCKSVLDAFHAIDPSLAPNSPDLFASWITLLSTHVRFAYTNDSQYLIYIGSIYAEGYGKNTTPFSTLDSVSGFGWNDLGDGGKRAGSVEETSDVWFAKVA